MDETITPQEGTNPEPEVVEETIEEETIETPEEQEVEETVSKSQFNQVLARAKKAEEALKKNNPPTNITNQKTLTQEDVDLRLLKAQGMTNELIKELKAVAKARGIEVLDAITDPIFIAIKDNIDKEEKAKKARLPASKGSSTVKKEKDINSPGLSEQEHKNLWKERMNK